MVRGWTERSCVQQDRSCREHQFDYPWSPLPDGVTECSFHALSRDPDSAGLNVRAMPDKNARVIGRVQPLYIEHYGKVLGEVYVIGYKNGWFLVALDPSHTDSTAGSPHQGPQPFIGRGWVAGGMLTAELLRNLLKQEPRETAVDVVNLYVEDDGSGQMLDPQSVKMRRLLSCAGDWVHVEIALVKGMKPLVATDTPAGVIRGWANGTCTSQLTTCDFSQDQPWSADASVPPE